jgi:hypothetical protein
MTERRHQDRRQLPALPGELSRSLDEAFSAEQRDALALVWQTNAGTLETVKAIVHGLGRTLRIGLATLFVLFFVTGFISARVLISQDGEAARLAAAIQTSRFDGTYRSCESTNARHAQALLYVVPLSKISPAAGLLTTELLNTLAPLRDGKDGRVSCSSYAAQQVALHVPKPFAPPVPPRHR